MTTPIFARKDPDNTVNVLDGEFNPGGKFALFVSDAAAAAILDEIAASTAATAGKNYAYVFGWTSGNLTSVTRTADGTSEVANFSYDVDGNLSAITPWA
jgi:hypothetical protein